MVRRHLFVADAGRHGSATERTGKEAAEAGRRENPWSTEADLMAKRKVYKRRRTFLLREDVDRMLANMVKANDGATMTSVVEYCIEYVAKRLDQNKREDDIVKRLTNIMAGVNAIRS